MLNTIRHMELFDNEKFNTPVTIIGAGALGSWLALFLAKLGITDITVYDFDEVESHNIANQAFNIHDIGKTKTQALQDIIAVQTNHKINIKNEKYTNQRLNGIVFLMVDSMKERKRIWEQSIKLKPAVKLMIEARMGLNMGRVYNVNPIDLEQGKRYEETLYSDDESEVSACGASMTVITTATAIASWCARQLINWHNESELDNEILIDFAYNNIITNTWK
jgi:molybdopterin/thiamine biosynthesis adenylyltransferase